MTYAFTQDVPIDAAFYQRIADGLGSEAPPGPVVHLAVERPEGGLRYTEVWELREDCDRFTEERLHPVVHELLTEIFGEHIPDEPARTEMRVVHVWGSTVARTAD